MAGQEQLLVETDDETMALPKQKPVGAIQLAANKFPTPDLEEVAKLLVGPTLRFYRIKTKLKFLTVLCSLRNVVKKRCLITTGPILQNEPYCT